MELRHLRYFVQVAEELHFARAAASLGISQPPLSQQIKALEDELGVRLFERTSRRVALTPAGKLFLGAAKATLEQAERAVLIARRAARGELGELAIGFSASAPFIPQIARAIYEFRRTFPEIRLTLTETGGSAEISAIEDGLLDLGFLRRSSRPALPDTVTAKLLLSERLYVAMRPDHPLAERPALSFQDLAGEPMLFYASDHRGAFTQELFQMLRAAGVEPVVAQTASEVSTLFGLAAAGVGITIVAESLRALQSANLVYREVIEESAVTTMWLLHRKESTTLACRNFIAMV
jgi:DNA-binding transcriptional LysR family regulator